MTRAEAARLAGLERQALRDAVVRYNAEVLDGLHDRPRPGQRPPGLCDQRYTWTHLLAAVQPKTSDAFALVLPELNTPAMQLFLDRFAATIPSGEHAAMVMDRAEWHTTDNLAVPVQHYLGVAAVLQPRTQPG